jgi:hypothetical protein
MAIGVGVVGGAGEQELSTDTAEDVIKIESDVPMSQQSE